MQSSCAAIWRLYGHRFNREIFRPTEKSKQICHLPLKSFLPVAAIETAAGIAVAISSVSIPLRQRMQIAVSSILSLPPGSPFFPSGPLTTSCRQRIVPNKRAFLCSALVSSFCASYFCLYLLAFHLHLPLAPSVARAVLSSLLVVRLLISNDE